MNINEMLQQPTTVPPTAVTPAPQAPTPTVRSGVTAEGIPFTVTVTGGDPAQQQAALKVNSIIQAQPAPTVTVNRDQIGDFLRQERPPRQRTPEEARYLELKLLVYRRLHNDLHAREAFQRQLKSMIRLHGFGRIGHSMFIQLSRRNAELLTKFRHLLTFLRTGEDTHNSEFFFNLYYADHKSFRNQFWEFWNLKHHAATTETPVYDEDDEDDFDFVDDDELPDEVPEEPPPAAAPVMETPTGVPSRCESCGRFVSQITRCCSHCGRRY